MRHLGTAALLVLAVSLAGCGSDPSNENTADTGSTSAEPDLTEKQVCEQLFPDNAALDDIKPLQAFIDKGGVDRLDKAKAALINLQVLAPRAPKPLSGQITDLVDTSQEIVDEVEAKGEADVNLEDWKAAGVALSATCVGLLGN